MGIDLDKVWGVIEKFVHTLKQEIIAIIDNEHHQNNLI